MHATGTAGQSQLQTGTGGSCGFGAVGTGGYPGSAIASISSSAVVVAALPESGCGACLMLTCMDPVRCCVPHACMHARSAWQRQHLSGLPGEDTQGSGRRRMP